MVTEITIDENGLLKQLTVRVRYKGHVKMMLRFKVALWLIRVAVWISGMGFEYMGSEADE